MKDQHGYLVGIEIKARATLEAKDIRSFQTLLTLADKHWIRGIVLYMRSDIIPFGKNLHAVPMSHLWEK